MERDTKLQQVQKNAKESISKQQQQFKILTNKINDLKLEIEKTEQLADRLKDLYHKKLLPKIKSFAESKVNIAKELDRRRYSVKLSKLQNKQLDAIIAAYLEDAFLILTPDDEAKKVYNQYHDEPYVEPLKYTEEDTKRYEFVADVLRNYGVKLNIHDLGEHPDYDQILQDIIRQQELQAESKKEKSQKQQLKEEAAALDSGLKQKSLRNVYISLAKILHPDKEQDAKLRKEKEELMKQITIAYEQKDLMALLNIEIAQMSKDSSYMQALTVDSIRQYTALLKDQEKSLQHELKMARNAGFVNLKIQLSKEPQLRQQIIDEADRYTNAILLYHEYMKSFNDKYELKNYLVHFLNNFYHESMATATMDELW